MKLYLSIFLSILLLGCSGGSNTPTVEPEIPYTQVFPVFETLDRYYGVRKELNENSWLFTGHVIDYDRCYRATNPSWCRKVQTTYKYDATHSSGREQKISFDITISKYNFIDSPDWIIIWQDWFRYDPLDTNGNHPFSTLKIKNIDGEMNLVAYNNAWQWNYTADNPFNPDDPFDSLHLHEDDTATGAAPIALNVTYHVEIIIEDGITPADGAIIIYVDDVLLSWESYQTKPTDFIEPGGVMQFGMYWSKFYNLNVNTCAEITAQPEIVCKSNQLTIENYTVLERFEL